MIGFQVLRLNWLKLLEKEESSSDLDIETRTLNDGRSFEIVKNFYEAADLVAPCVRAGFDITMRQTATSFLYGFGTRLPSERNSENLSHG